MIKTHPDEYKGLSYTQFCKKYFSFGWGRVRVLNDVIRATKDKKLRQKIFEEMGVIA